jgi:hypothetical protein
LLALANRAVALQVECHVGLTLRLPEHDVEVRLLPTPAKKARLLDQTLSTAPRALHQRWVVMAVLALHTLHGKPPALEEESSREAPRSRPQVLASTRELLETMATVGIAHGSPRMVERLFTLAISAAAVHLPRLSHLLKALADEVSQLVSRTAAADTQRLFDAMSWAHALARAIEAAEPNVPRELAGVARTQYDPVGDLGLAGVAAYPWQTASGFEGVTLLCWDVAGQCFVTWSTSRPTTTPGRFDLDRVYRYESAWSGGGSPERLSRSSFVLRQGRANALGRLSGGQQAIVAELKQGDPLQLDFGNLLFQDWNELARYAASLYPIGLRLRNLLDRIVVLQPTEWGERSFDEMQQAFCWLLQDGAGRSLLVTLPWNGLNEMAIEFLEAVKPERDRLLRMVVRLVFPGHGFRVEPLALHGAGTSQGAQVLNPWWDRGLIESRQSDLLARLRKKFGRDRVPTAMTADDEWVEMHEAGLAGTELAPGLRRFLGETEALLLQLAEAGVHRLDDRNRSRLASLAAQLTRRGLRELGAAVDSVLQGGPTAAQVLASNYLCRLCLQALGAPIVEGEVSTP